MKRSPRWPALLVIAAVAAVIFILVLAADRGGSSPGGGGSAFTPRDAAARCPDARAGLAWYRRHHARWYWQTGMRERPQAVGEFGYMPCAAVRQAAELWRGRARGARKAYVRWFHAAYRKWECVHSQEAAWNAATGNGYYGGLQMDWNFMSAYGPSYLRRWGHAGRWPVWAQLVAAERAYASRGWQPWPNTARECGLL